MIWRGVPRAEWFTAAILLASSITSTLWLWQESSLVDEATARRRVQVCRLAELVDAFDTPARSDLASLEGLFPGHVLALGRAPWGEFLAVRAVASDEAVR